MRPAKISLAGRRSAGPVWRQKARYSIAILAKLTLWHGTKVPYADSGHFGTIYSRGALRILLMRNQSRRLLLTVPMITSDLPSGGSPLIGAARQKTSQKI